MDTIELSQNWKLCVLAPQEDAPQQHSVAMGIVAQDDTRTIYCTRTAMHLYGIDSIRASCKAYIKLTAEVAAQGGSDNG